jgi:predicted AlkP superfamily pyrophosphatase or phosphodiesterase
MPNQEQLPHVSRCGKRLRAPALLLNGALLLSVCAGSASAQSARSPASPKPPQRPKLVVLLVVDQMRGDYVDKFRGQWTGGLKRLVDQGAWFRAAAYPYAATETCVGHATIATGALPSTHGMIANAWWDRDAKKMVTCTADPNAKNYGYAGATAKGGDTAWRMLVPSFAEELKFQTGGATRVVTFSLKARAAITLAGHKGDAATWFDSGGWMTSSAYGTMPFIDDYVKAHPMKADLGKTWNLSLPESFYWYDAKALGAAPPEGWDLAFPHVLGGTAAAMEANAAFYEQWASSPFADAYLTHLAETAVDQLGLGGSAATDFLGVGYSSIDYVGHEFGPRSREMQDILITLDKDLAELFTHLDKKVGRGNYVVALSADHGVAPIPDDMAKTGAEAGLLRLPEVQERIEKVLDSLNYPKPAIARVSGSDIYFVSTVYDRLRQDRAAMQAVADAAMAQPGMGSVYWAEDVQGQPATQSPTRQAVADSYFPGRSGDLILVPRPYWLIDSTPAGKVHPGGTGHGTPYNYDQHVPILLMGYGIQPGEYYREVTPADIAPTLASLCNVTLAARDGHILAEALAKPAAHSSRSTR